MSNPILDHYHEALAANRARWDEVTPIHARSAFYDVAGFKAGRSTLHALERAELGDVAGKRLLHAQCHFGLDTLSWARLGAQVTGVDFSPAALALARDLATETGLAARFIEANVYALPDELAGQFDIVFTSHGVLCWLPDLPRWAAALARCLAPGGVFYLMENHPLLNIFANERDVTGFTVAHSYFHQTEPVRWEPDGSYADPTVPVTCPAYEWTHSLSDVVNAVLGAGLRLEFLHEFPVSAWACLPFMTQDADGWWRLRPNDPALPLLFSLRASKPR